MFSDESTLQSFIYTTVCCIDFMYLIASAGEIIFVFYLSVGGGLSFEDRLCVKSAIFLGHVKGPLYILS
jgi:hypothetical protein